MKAMLIPFCLFAMFIIAWAHFKEINKKWEVDIQQHVTKMHDTTYCVDTWIFVGQRLPVNVRLIDWTIGWHQSNDTANAKYRQLLLLKPKILKADSIVKTLNTPTN